MVNIAVLLTCYNRKEKTISCLDSFYKCIIPEGYSYKIFLVDDGSTDGTKESVMEKFPLVEIVDSGGNLYWAGGMRLAWEYSKKDNEYDGYLLLNDDVILIDTVLLDLVITHKFCINNYNTSGVYVSSTYDSDIKEVSYGGRILRKNIFSFSLEILQPGLKPKICSLANANILLVMRTVVDEIGFFDKHYTHGIADYDYTYGAYKKNIPVLVSSNIGGYCKDDHGKNWLTSSNSLKERINFLYSVKGLAYKESMYYLKKNFPRFVPYYFSMFWLKTFFPKIWEYLK